MRESRVAGEAELETVSKTNVFDERVFELEREIEVLRHELRQSETQRQKGLEALAGGLARDFNNVLLAIMGHADLAMFDVELRSKAHESLQEICAASERAAQLTMRLMSYAGHPAFDLTPLDLNRLVKEQVAHYESWLPRGIRIHCGFPNRLPRIDGNADQLAHALKHIVRNASEAIDDRKEGLITVSTGTIRANRAYLSDCLIDDHLPAGEYAFVEVTDNGHGIENEHLIRIFDPFFTTKPAQRGFGLASVLGIVRGHHGAIRVSSVTDHGTTFRLLLPALDRESEASPPSMAEDERFECEHSSSALGETF